MTEIALQEIREHMDALGPVDFIPVRSKGRRGEIQVRDGDESFIMSVRRDFEATSEGDVEFISYLTSDIRNLLTACCLRERVDPALLDQVRARIASASIGPWFPFLESDGGQGGCDFIRVGDQNEDEPDLYLWVNGRLAPSRYFLFVGEARQDIVKLVAIADSLSVC